MGHPETLGVHNVALAQAAWLASSLRAFSALGEGNKSKASAVKQEAEEDRLGKREH